MPWIADLHIHSHFSMATSKECNPKNLHRWAGLKGLSLVGTGDFTHPGWRKELAEEIVPAEPGFYRLAEEVAVEIPDQPEVRFVISGELSTIYKKNGKTRKVHHLIILPSLEAADQISAKLEGLGMNIHSDGRPILGLDSYRLLDLVLNICPETIFIPAHIWTPHFSVFGSNSGFDDITECYEDLTEYIYALETGLSSDPAMNRRWSLLDRFSLVSNSDAHNPQNLAREANLLDAEFSYKGLQNALQNRGEDRLLGTIEFFPEEGKYHLDGHRNCEISWEPSETRKHDGICPVCGKKVTVGVLHRVTELADRSLDDLNIPANTFESLVPLRQIIADSFNTGVSSQKVEQSYFSLLSHFGPELKILREVDTTELENKVGPLLATAIRRLRDGNIEIKAGYDGEYGVISVFNEAERRSLQGQTALFTGLDTKKPRKSKIVRQEAATQEPVISREGSSKNGLNSDSIILNQEQQDIVESTYAKISVIAGPGSGKTRTLVEKLIYLIETQQVNPGEITAVTFTHKAAAEIRQRVQKRIGNHLKLAQLHIGTFHSLAWQILNTNPDAPKRMIIDQNEAKDIIEELLRNLRIPKTAKEAALIISQIKNSGSSLERLKDYSPQIQELYRAYQERLDFYQRWDYDDIILETVKLWQINPDWLHSYRKQFNYLFIDEFQDLNDIQYQLIKYWTQDGRQLLVIGDPNQSIYGFRGSSNRFFQELAVDYPEIVNYRLTGNYRSPEVVTAAANTLIASEYHQVIRNETGRGADKIVWLEAPGEKQAAQAVVNEIVALLGGSTMLNAHGQKKTIQKLRKTEDNFSLSEIAILYRTGRQSEIMEEALIAAGLPYRVVGQTPTLESVAVKEFLAFFRYLYHPEDYYLLRTVLKQPRWGLSLKEVDALTQFFHDLLHNNGLDANKNIIGSLLEENLLIEKSLPLEETLRNKYLHFLGVVQYFQKKLGMKSMELLQEWIVRQDMAGRLEMDQFLKISENHPEMAEFLKFLPLAEEADLSRYGQHQKSEDVETITLSTIHASKGLEFPVVFLCGAVEGLIPLGNTIDKEILAEEERLFYVAITRAQQNLYFVNSEFSFRNNDLIPNEPSRFISKIPPDLLEKIKIKRETRVKQLELF